MVSKINFFHGHYDSYFFKNLAIRVFKEVTLKPLESSFFVLFTKAMIGSVLNRSENNHVFGYVKHSLKGTKIISGLEFRVLRPVTVTHKVIRDHLNC